MKKFKEVWMKNCFGSKFPIILIKVAIFKQDCESYIKRRFLYQSFINKDKISQILKIDKSFRF